MKITFIYFDFVKGAGGKYYEGIASLSAVLKKKGHQTKLFHIQDTSEIDGFSEVFDRYYSDADVVAFSATSTLFPYVKEHSLLVKNKCPRIVTICGGPHPTIDPEGSIQTEGLDVICIGEGEYPLLDLCNCLENNQDYTTIKNLWVKKDGEVFRNSLRPLIENLDSLPFPDRELFDFEKSQDMKMNRLPFMGSRGCPFNCTHCCNHAFKQIIAEGSKYVRFKSVDRLIAEVKHEITRYPEIQNIHFLDDILTINKTWFAEFAEKYNEQIGLAYVCNCRFELLGPEMIDSLKHSNCSRINLGLESGDTYIRYDVLQRKQSEELITEVCKQLHEKGVEFSLYFMVGIPYETMSRALNSVKMCAKLKPINFQLSIFYPFEHTRLHEICIEQNFMTDKKLDSYFDEDTVLSLPDFPRKKIVFAYQNFENFVKLFQFNNRLGQPFRVVLDKFASMLWLCPGCYMCVYSTYLVFKKTYRSVKRLFKPSKSKK